MRSPAIIFAAVVASLTLATTANARPSVALQISKTIVSTWRCQEQLQLPRTQYSVSPWALPKSHAYRVWVLQLWTERRKACIEVLHEKIRQWNWQAFLPGKWQRVGMCETGLNWFHANGRFVSAFGISRQTYDEDASVYGVPGWDDGNTPSPWQQYQAALGHYKLHGGFSGWGCRGA